MPLSLSQATARFSYLISNTYVVTFDHCMKYPLHGFPDLLNPLSPPPLSAKTRTLASWIRAGTDKGTGQDF